MGEVQALSGLDRLPWLADDTPAPSRRPARWVRWPLWLAAASGLALVAAGAYWFGRSTVDDLAPSAAVPAAPITVPLPAPRTVPPDAQQPEVPIASVPEVAPIAAPPEASAPIPAPVVHRRVPRARPHRQLARTRAPAAPSRVEKPAPATQHSAPTDKPAAPPAALPVWPVRAEQNAYGRLVRVGTFADTSQAKRGWTRIMRFYPGMKRLPALVVPIQAVPSGRRYYRLQMGTTSQAHSEVLCQRMRIIGVSCVVLDIGPTVRRG